MSQLQEHSENTTKVCFITVPQKNCVKETKKRTKKPQKRPFFTVASKLLVCIKMKPKAFV
jgi:hypothetical protein